MQNNKPYKCIIVDDETLARQLIQMHLKQFQKIEIVQSFSSATDALEYLKTNSVDLIFLDIQMPKLTGMDFLKSLVNPPKVIFTTAYSEFALDAYELNVIDYLLKPITLERFEKAANKVVEILNLERVAVSKNLTEIQDKSILIRSSHQLIKIDINSILYIEALHKYIKIVTAGKNYTTLFSMNSIEKELPSTKFYRCHRSFIVNLNEINVIDGNQVVIDKHKIPVSKLNKTELVSKLGKSIG